jgi:hypothetical protein
LNLSTSKFEEERFGILEGIQMVGLVLQKSMYQLITTIIIIIIITTTITIIITHFQYED